MRLIQDNRKAVLVEMERSKREVELRNEGLLKEGEKLSRRVADQTNVIKQLLSIKEENEATIQSIKRHASEAAAQVEVLQASLKCNDSDAAQLRESHKRLEASFQTQAERLQQLENQLGNTEQSHVQSKSVLDQTISELTARYEQQLAELKATQASEIVKLSADLEKAYASYNDLKQQSAMQQEGLQRRLGELQKQHKNVLEEANKREAQARDEINVGILLLFFLRI